MRRTLLLLTTMALALLMASSVALALNRISCTGGSCYGTSGDDSMSGTAGSDNMVGYEGNDTLNGRGGGDNLTGDAETGTLGNDTLNGGGGDDELGDRFGTNTLIGGAGSDYFYADYAAQYATFGYDEISEISGGSGNDTVYALDGAKDTINCGAGNDWVRFDSGLDVVRGCEQFSTGQ
jgi:Ca2+-binding RTX toxin-like protein